MATMTIKTIHHVLISLFHEPIKTRTMVIMRLVMIEFHQFPTLGLLSRCHVVNRFVTNLSHLQSLILSTLSSLPMMAICNDDLLEPPVKNDKVSEVNSGGAMRYVENTQKCTRLNSILASRYCLLGHAGPRPALAWWWWWKWNVFNMHVSRGPAESGTH